MKVLYELIRDANIHMNTHQASLNVGDVEKVARWITKIVGIFGLDANASPPYEGLGWMSSTVAITDPKEAVAPYAAVYREVLQQIGGLNVHSETLDTLATSDADAEFASVVSTGANDIESISLPYLRSISRIRDELRRTAPTLASKKEILALSDRIRDQYLTNLGVYLDDRPDNQPSLIKFVPRDELIAQREEKLAKEREKAALKEAARLSRERQELEKAEKAKLPPSEMFKDYRFSAWDSDGLPTKLKDGEDVPKSQLKKLKKDWDRQKKLYDEYQK